MAGLGNTEMPNMAVIRLSCSMGRVSATWQAGRHQVQCQALSYIIQDDIVLYIYSCFLYAISTQTRLG